MTVPGCTCSGHNLCTRCVLAQYDHEFVESRDLVIDWETAQRDGLFSMAADLVVEHQAFLAASGNVVVLETWREGRA